MVWFLPQCTYGASDSKPYCDEEYAKRNSRLGQKRSSYVEARDFTYIFHFLINYPINGLSKYLTYN
jgi:CDGSH-type Zn-finger protein